MADDGKFFIHLDDPGFPDPPWPFQRRLGPYDTHEEAVRQAVSDLAGGHSVGATVYSHEESEKLRDGARAKAHASPAELNRLAKAERKRRDRLAELERLKAAELRDEHDALLREMLPDGVDLDALRAAGLLA